MPEDISTDRPLFGGAISSTFPVRFQVSSLLLLLLFLFMPLIYEKNCFYVAGC
jgi:hypothetical protein